MSPARRCSIAPTWTAISGVPEVRDIISGSGAGALDMLLDPEGRFEVGAEVVPVDPLKFRRLRAAIPTVSPPPPTIPAKPMRWS